jgi:hypothetical protein
MAKAQEEIVRVKKDSTILVGEETNLFQSQQVRGFKKGLADPEKDMDIPEAS